MSLANRLRSAQKSPSNAGCMTCNWWHTINKDTQKLINEWLDSKSNRTQLYEILTTPTEDQDEPPLTVSNSGWRWHLKHHDERCR